MANKNLLAILMPRDEDHYLVQDFLKSLPEGAKKVFDSLGNIGDLEKRIRYTERKQKETTRHFVVFHSPNSENLDTKYFSITHGAALIEIPDRLKVKIVYTQENAYLDDYVLFTEPYEGSIDEMLSKYNLLSSRDPRELLVYSLNKSQFFRDNMIKNRFFGLGRAKLASTYVSVGIETLDSNYLIGTVGAFGPYRAVFKTKRPIPPFGLL